MRLPLDSHVWLWMLSEPERVGKRTRSMLEDAQTDLLLAGASVWEISNKYQLGNLSLPKPLDRFVPSRMNRIEYWSHRSLYLTPW